MAILTTTIAQFRVTKSKPTASAYYLTDEGKEGFFVLSATKAEDNGGTVLRNAKGYALERQYRGQLPMARWFDIVPDGRPIGKLLNDYIATLPAGGRTAPLLFEAGRYNANDTTINTRHSGLGFVCHTGLAMFLGNGKQPVIISGKGAVATFYGIGAHNGGYKELKNEDGSLLTNLQDPRLKQLACMICYGVTDISRCVFEETPGYNLVLEGWLPESNTSGSHIHNINLFQRGFRALYIEGADSNASVIDGANDFRDNGGGIVDVSLLGNTVVGNMFHENKSGHIQVRGGGGNMSFVAGNYEEGDSIPDVYTGQSTVIGNRHSGIPNAGEYVYLQNPSSQLIQQETSYGLQVNRIKGRQDNIAETFMSGTTLAKPGTQETRTMRSDGVNLNNPLKNHRYDGYAVQDIADVERLDIPFKAGDIVEREGVYQRHLPNEWRCFQGGNSLASPLNIKASVTPNSGGRLVLEGNISQLQAGQVLEVAGHVVTIDGTHNDPNNGIVAAGSYYLPNFKSASLSYAKPKFQAMGRGVGTLAQRPMLRPDDIGWSYFATDEGKESIWLGTKWSA